MRRLFELTLTLLLALPAPAWAWMGGGGFPSANPAFTGAVSITGTLTLTSGQLIVPRGSASLPSVAIGEASTGWYQPSTGTMRMSSLGSDNVIIGVAQIAVDGYAWPMSTQVNTLTGSNLTMSGDTVWGREASAIWQSGADAASPVAQTIKGADARAGTDTNSDGGDLTIAAGRPTGTGTPGVLYLATSTTSAVSGTGAAALANRVTVSEWGMAPPSVTYANVGSVPNGRIFWCTDCDPPTLVDQTCASVGTKTGSLAFKVNNAAKCVS